jgi:hypothetical protein
MRSLSSYLAKFSTITPPNRTIKRTCCDLLHEQFGITVEPSDVEVKQKTIYINGSAALKQEIFFRRNELRQKCNEALAPLGFSIDDIR